MPENKNNRVMTNEGQKDERKVILPKQKTSTTAIKDLIIVFILRNLWSREVNVFKIIKMIG